MVLGQIVRRRANTGHPVPARASGFSVIKQERGERYKTQGDTDVERINDKQDRTVE